MVGVMMMGEAAKIKWERMNDALPAFLTIILMPLTYSITNGMIFGLLAAFGFYFTTGQFIKDTSELHSNCMPQNSAITIDDQEEETQTTKLIPKKTNGGESYGTV